MTKMAVELIMIVGFVEQTFFYFSLIPGTYFILNSSKNAIVQAGPSEFARLGKNKFSGRALFFLMIL